MANRAVVGVTGSIAAYKAAEVVRLLMKAGWEVRVVMTRAATRFVGELTFRALTRQPVAVDMFEAPDAWLPEHLALADWAEVLAVAPCTANVLAKLAHGGADDLLTAVALACRAPLVVAPAMNEKMWDHPATQANVRLLRERGVRLVGPAEGALACGAEGRGRMAEPEDIVAAIRACGAKSA